MDILKSQCNCIPFNTGRILYGNRTGAEHNILDPAGTEALRLHSVPLHIGTITHCASSSHFDRVPKKSCVLFIIFTMSYWDRLMQRLHWSGGHFLGHLSPYQFCCVTHDFYLLIISLGTSISQELRDEYYDQNDTLLAYTYTPSSGFFQVGTGYFSVPLPDDDSQCNDNNLVTYENKLGPLSCQRTFPVAGLEEFVAQCNVQQSVARYVNNLWIAR